MKYPHQGCFKVPIHNSTQSNSVCLQLFLLKSNVPISYLDILLNEDLIQWVGPETLLL